MKIQNTIIKRAALIGVALALIALLAPRPPAVAEGANDKKAVSMFFPPITAAGKVKSRINIMAAAAGTVVKNPPAAQKATLVFDIFKAEPPPSPIVDIPCDAISDNPPSACVKYEWVARQQCEVEISANSGGSFVLNHANLQNEDYLIRTSIIIIGSDGGIISPCDILGSVEVTANNGSTEVLRPLHDHGR